MLQQLDEHHGLPDGIFSCDEHYAGRDPSQGTELCTIVEAMFSYEILESILGDPMLGDRLEKVTYNALPGAMTADMWAHQYDEQPNQVLVSKEKRDWTTNGPDSNLFGLEPNFGCCTANYHQGWPKFVAGTVDGAQRRRPGGHGVRSERGPHHRSTRFPWWSPKRPPIRSAKR